MPHLRLEYTENIKTNISPELFDNLINILIDNTTIKSDNCKNRAIKINNSNLDSKKNNRAFIHLEIIILEGRSEKVKQKIGKQSLKILKSYFNDSLNANFPQISLEIREMKQTNYFTTNTL